MRVALCLLSLLYSFSALAATAEQLQVAQDVVTRINLYRSIHGIDPVVLDNAFVEGCIAHANYLDLNPSQLSNPYTEDLSLPGATSAGKAVAEVSNVSYDIIGVASIDSLFNNYANRGFLLAGDFTKAGYGDTPGTSGGRPIAVIRTGDVHSPTGFVSPPNGAKGVAATQGQTGFLATLGPAILLYGESESSNIEIVSSSITSGGAAIEHTATAKTTSGSRPNLLKDIHLAPNALPVNSLITVVIDYKENGQTKHAEWSFTTSETGAFDPVAAATAIPPGPGGGTPSDTTDADADGFPANVEIAAGTSATDAASTPFSGEPAGTAQALNVLKASIKLNFAKADSDSIQFNGALSVPAGFVPTGVQVIVDVGGAARAFSLTEKGSGVNGASSFKLSKPKDNMAKYKAKLGKGNFAIDLADDGLSNTTAVDASVTVPVTVYFNGTVLRLDVAKLYTAKAGKTGRTK